MHEADMGDDPAGELTQAEIESLRRLAGVMLPSSQAYRVPGADDPVIFADIIRSLGRDAKDVRKALAMLQAMVEDDFATIDAGKARRQRRRYLLALDRRSRPSGVRFCNATTATTECSGHWVWSHVRLFRTAMLWRKATGHCSRRSVAGDRCGATSSARVAANDRRRGPRRRATDGRDRRRAHHWLGGVGGRSGLEPC
jgi:hypothetical protein